MRFIYTFIHLEDRTKNHAPNKEQVIYRDEKNYRLQSTNHVLTLNIKITL